MYGNSDKLVYARNSLLILVSLFFCFSSAQGQSLSGPLLGFVRDTNDLSIKPIFGIPGAAVLGSGLELPLRFLRVEFSLKTDYAIAVTEWDSELVLLRNLSGHTTFESIFQGDSKIEQIALSRNGAYAALLSGNVIRVLSGLPSQSRIIREVYSPAERPVITAMAVNDDGEIAAAFSDGPNGMVYWSGKSAELQPIAAAGNVSALAFVRGRGIVIADRLFNEISLISGLPSNPWSIRLADTADDISSPAALGISDSGSRAFVANEQSGDIVIIDLAGGKPERLSCECRPSSLRMLRGQAVFALTEPAGGPVVVLDAHEDARVVVVSNPIN